MTPLYTKGRDGAVRIWRVWAEGSEVVTQYGLAAEGSALTTARRRVLPKNVGRSNATTAEEQALKEVQAEWSHKRSRKYTEDPAAAQPEIPLPMLAHDASKKSKYIKYPLDVQPKLDGLRCLATNAGGWSLLSRQGREFDVPHVVRALEQLGLPEGTVLDGELYTHGVPFQTLASWVKRQRPEQSRLEYHVYDVPSQAGTWAERAKTLSHLPTDVTIRRVESARCLDLEAVLSEQAWALGVGYEGVMLRALDGHYEWGHRSPGLLKMKLFQDAEFTVVGVEEEGMGTGLAVFVCQTEDGKEFRARPRGSAQQRREWYHAAPIGKPLTVRFFERTLSGVPRFPVGVGFRPPEDLP